MARMCELVVAAGAGDLAAVRKAIEKGAKPSDANYDKRTALHAAAAEGKIPVVRRLVEEMGAKINAKDQWGGTPLDDALRGGHKAVVEFLVTRGAHCGKKCAEIDDFRLLFEAAAKDNANCIRSLLRRSVNVSEGNCDKRTALHIACENGSLSVVKCLIEEAKANPSATDRLGGCPLDDALRCNHKKVAEYLRKSGAQAGQAVVNTEAAAALCDAASKGDVNTLRELRAGGVDVNSGDYDMRTAIHLAASEGILEVIETIVNELGGNQNVTDRWGGTPLDDAIRSGHGEVQAWLEANDGVRGYNQMFSNEAGLLCDAASKGDSKVFVGLAKQSADMNMPNIDGRTALHIAAAEGNLQCVQVLITELGVELNPKDRWNQTPLDDAVHGGFDDVVKFLKENGAQEGKLPTFSGDSAIIIEAIKTRDGDRLRTLVQDKGLDADAATFDQRTPLHVSCSMGLFELVKILVEEFNVNVNPVDHGNGTPLDDAVDAENVEIQQFLEGKGAVRSRTAVPVEHGQTETIVDQEAGEKETLAVARVDRTNSALLTFGFAACCCEDSRDLTMAR